MGVADRQRDILRVEDSPEDAKIFQRAVREYRPLPYRLHVVPDGEAALAFLRREGSYAAMPRPQLLLLDIGLPKIDGWEVLERIRATPTLATLPAVMLTGIMADRDEERRAVWRPLACLEKPMPLEEYPRLVEQLEQFLDTIPYNG